MTKRLGIVVLGLLSLIVVGCGDFGSVTQPTRVSDGAVSSTPRGDIPPKALDLTYWWACSTALERLPACGTIRYTLVVPQ